MQIVSSQRRQQRYNNTVQLEFRLKVTDGEQCATAVVSAQMRALGDIYDVGTVIRVLVYTSLAFVTPNGDHEIGLLLMNLGKITAARMPDDIPPMGRPNLAAWGYIHID